MTWWQDAACKDLDTELFYDDAHEATCILLCERCPVRQPCRDAALEEEKGEEFVFGVRGGWTAEQRKHDQLR